MTFGVGLAVKHITFGLQCGMVFVVFSLMPLYTNAILPNLLEAAPFYMAEVRVRVV
jgi:hypothetical protein